MIYKVTLNGKVYEVEVEQGEAMIVDEYELSAVSKSASVMPARPAESLKCEDVSGTPVTAPLPGNVLDIKVKIGDSVKAGNVLLIIEAMKMENEVVSPSDGVVKNIVVSKGAMVATGDTLIVI